MLSDERSIASGRRARLVGRAGAVVFVAALLLAVAPLTPAPAAQLPTAADDAPTPAILNLTEAGYDDQSTTVAVESLPPASQIGPGSHLFIRRDGGLYACTANFVYRSASTMYLGSAGHCFLAEDKTATHGPGADATTSGVKVSVCVDQCYFGGQTGFIYRGVEVALGSVAYARQNLNGDVAGYDFGLVAIPSGLASRVRPSMPVWGGPSGIAPNGLLGAVCHYGYGMVVGETFPTQARAGIGIVKSERQWNGYLASAMGDSGAAVVTCAASENGLQGVGAVGLITHISVGAATITLGTSVDQAIALAREAGLSVTLVTA